MKSIVYGIINGYINVGTGEYLLYNTTQMNYVFELLEGTAEAKNPEDILNNIKQIEESIAVSQLTTEEQEPLLYATQIGKTAYAYWANILAAGPGMYGSWNDFIVSFTPAIVKFPFWIAAAMEGTLIANSMMKQRLKGQFAAELQLVINFLGTPLVVSLAGSLAAGAGKVAFNIQKRRITDCKPMQPLPEIIDVNNDLDFTKPCNC
jgi:hypothetical protein